MRWSIFERPKVEDVQACAVRSRGSEPYPYRPRLVARCSSCFAAHRVVPRAVEPAPGELDRHGPGAPDGGGRRGAPEEGVSLDTVDRGRAVAARCLVRAWIIAPVVFGGANFRGAIYLGP